MLKSKCKLYCSDLITLHPLTVSYTQKLASITFILVSHFRAKLLHFFRMLNYLCLWKSLRVCWTWVWCVSGCFWPPHTSLRSGTLCWWTPAGLQPAACHPETKTKNIQILVFQGQLINNEGFMWLLIWTFSVFGAHCVFCKWTCRICMLY